MYRYNREELYERAWSTPMQKLAKEYGLSDVGLAKTCRKLCIPVPRRGYWEECPLHLRVTNQSGDG